MDSIPESPTPSPSAQGAESQGSQFEWLRVRQATGTVYGDIGTSVLYTIMEITREAVLLKHHHSPAIVEQLKSEGGALLSRADHLGSLSLVFWALIFLTVKYDLMIMGADHRGEGGDFA